MNLPPHTSVGCLSYPPVICAYPLRIHLAPGERTSTCLGFFASAEQRRSRPFFGGEVSTFLKIRKGPSEARNLEKSHGEGIEGDEVEFSSSRTSVHSLREGLVDP